MSETTVLVNERKFNGVGTYEIQTDSKDKARAAARMFWREEYGTTPSKIVVEDVDMWVNKYDVMVADHSSGSLKDGKEYEL